MAIIYGKDGSVTVTGKESSTGQPQVIKPPSSATKQTGTTQASGNKSSSSSSGSSNVKAATTSNVPEAMKNVKAGSAETVKVGDSYYYRDSNGVINKANIVNGKPYNPYERFEPQEKQTGTMKIGNKTYNVMTVTQRKEVPTGQPNEQKVTYSKKQVLVDPATGQVVYDASAGKASTELLTIKNGMLTFPSGETYEDVSSYQSEGGLLTNISITEGGKTTTINPFTGEVFSIKNQSTIMDFSTGKAYDLSTNTELNPLKGTDYKKIKELGVTLNFDEEALGASDWYATESDTKAQQQAQNLAYSTASAINAQYGAEVVKVTSEGGTYTVELIEPAKKTGFTTTLKNAITGYSKVNPYAQAIEEAPGKFRVVSKPVGSQAYLSSKAYGGNMPVGLSLDETSLEPKITFMSGETKQYSELTDIQRQIFDTKFSGELGKMATDISSQVRNQSAINTAIYGAAFDITKVKEHKPIKFEKEGGIWKLSGLPEQASYESKSIFMPRKITETERNVSNYMKIGKPHEFDSGTMVGDLIRSASGSDTGEPQGWVRVVSLESRNELTASASGILGKIEEPETIGGKISYEYAKFWQGMEGWIQGIESYDEGAKSFAEPLVSLTKTFTVSGYDRFYNPEYFKESIKKEAEFTAKFTGNVLHAGAGIYETATYFIPLAGGALSIAEMKLRGMEDTDYSEAGAFMAASTYSAAGVSSLPRSLTNLAALSIAPYPYLIGGAVGGVSSGSQVQIEDGQLMIGYEAPGYEQFAPSFEAGAISSVAFGTSRQAGNVLLRIIPEGGGVEVGKRLVASYGSGFIGGAGYSATKDVFENKNPDIEKATVFGAIGGGFAVAGEGLTILYEHGITPKIGYGKVEYKQLSPVEKQHAYSGIYYERGFKASPLVGLQDWKPVIGTPTLPSSGVMAYPMATNPFETAVLTPAYTSYAQHLAGLNAAEQRIVEQQMLDFAGKMGGDQSVVLKYLMPEKGGLAVVATRWEAGYPMLRYTYMSSDPANIRMSFKDVIAQSPLFERKGAAERISEILAEDRTKLIIAGSVPQKMWMAEAMPRTPHDIDMILLSETPEDYAEKLVAKLTPVYGADIRVSPERPSLVEIYKPETNTWVHGFDIHSRWGDVTASGDSVLSTEWIGYGMKPKAPFITTEGYQIYSLQEQGARKGVSTLTARSFGFSPEAHRLKDVVDFLDVSKFKAELQGRTDILKLEEQFRSTVPKEVFESLGESGGATLIYPSPYYLPYSDVSPFISGLSSIKISPSQQSKDITGYEAQSPDFKGIEIKGYGYTEEAPGYSYKMPSYELKAESGKVSPSYKAKSPSYGYGYKTSPPVSPSPTASPKASPRYKQDYKYAYKSPMASPVTSPKASPGYKYDYKYGYNSPSPSPSPKYGYNYKYDYGYKYGYNPPSPSPSPNVNYKILPPLYPIKLPPPGKDNVQFMGQKPQKNYYLEGERSIFSDLLSVAKSQYRYGKATHPNPRKRPYIYEYEESTIPRVPTVEMLNRKRKGIKTIKAKRIARAKI